MWKILNIFPQFEILFEFNIFQKIFIHLSRGHVNRRIPLKFRHYSAKLPSELGTGFCGDRNIPSKFEGNSEENTNSAEFPPSINPYSVKIPQSYRRNWVGILPDPEWELEFLPGLEFHLFVGNSAKIPPKFLPAGRNFYGIIAEFRRDFFLRWNFLGIFVFDGISAEYFNYFKF